MTAAKTPSGHVPTNDPHSRQAVVICRHGDRRFTANLPHGLIEEIERLGFPRRKQEVTFLSQYEDFRTWKWPRNVAWQSLPSLAIPQYQPWGYRSYIGSTNLGKVALADAIFIDADLVQTPAFSHFLGMWDDTDPSSRPRFHQFRGSEICELSHGDLDAVRSRSLAEERFIWNHVLNCVILCARAVYQVWRERNGPRESFVFCSPNLEGRIQWYFGHPIALQVLYLLRRELGENPPPALAPRKSLVDDWFALLKGCSFLKVSDDGRNCTFSWSGTGRYPSLECEFAPVPVIGGFGFLHFETTPLILQDLSLILSKLFVNDLIGFSQDERLCITKDGLRFLELIGSEMDDPDMLLRWRNDNGCWGAPEDIPPMDRWLNKGFRSIKRRVSHLPSSPFTEPDAPWDKVPHTHRVIFGRYVPLSRGDWDRLDVQEAVHAIDVINKGVDWQDTRYGVVRNKMYLGSKEEPIGLWIGVPVGQFDIGTISQRRVGPLVDQSEVTEEASALALDPLAGFVNPAVHELDFWVVDRVDEKSARLFPYDPSLDRLPNEARPIVTHAKWLR